MQGMFIGCTIRSQKVIETRDVHAWADITNAANDIRLTMQQVVDPEFVLEQIEPVEEVPINMEDEFLQLISFPNMTTNSTTCLT